MPNPIALLLDDRPFQAMYNRISMQNAIAWQLTKRLGELSQDVRTSVLGLPLPALEELGEALLDFTSLADLPAWLEGRSHWL